VFLDFSRNGKKIELDKLDANQVSNIIKDYKSHVEKITWDDFGKMKVSIFRTVWLLITKKLCFTNPFKGLHELRRINVYTMHKKEALSSTTIELDADILTVLHPKLYSHHMRDLIFSLHDSNVKLANRFYQYRLSRLVYDLKNLVNLVRLATIPVSVAHIWLGLATEPNLIGFAFNAVALPILWRLMPKIMLRVFLGIIKLAIK
jgi:hypothetical protein